MTIKTRLTLSIDELDQLICSMESEHTDYMDKDDLANHDRLHAKLVKTIQRIGGE